MGADHLSEGVEELRTKSLIVVLDVLDVLELQSCVWEGTTLCLGLRLFFVFYKTFSYFRIYKWVLSLFFLLHSTTTTAYRLASRNFEILVSFEFPSSYEFVSTVRIWREVENDSLYGNEEEFEKSYIYFYPVLPKFVTISRVAAGWSTEKPNLLKLTFFVNFFPFFDLKWPWMAFKTNIVE